jgi:hypothetical protein
MNLLHTLVRLLKRTDESSKPQTAPAPAPVVTETPPKATQTKRELEVALRAQGLSRVKAKREVARRYHKARRGRA